MQMLMLGPKTCNLTEDGPMCARNAIGRRSAFISPILLIHIHILSRLLRTFDINVDFSLFLSCHYERPRIAEQSPSRNR